MKIYDCIVIGGGFAGLSAAIYLARFNRSILVVDKKQGRSSFPQQNENYLGFPDGISARKLRKLGRIQAEKYGACIEIDEIRNIEKISLGFKAAGKQTLYEGRTLIFATGVRDLFANIRDFGEYVGISLFWCIICDGYKALHKKVVIVGNSDDAAVTCMQFLNFTSDLVFITNQNKAATNISAKKIERFKIAHIPFYEEKIVTIIGENGKVDSIRLSNGKIISCDLIFSEQGEIPNSKLAEQIGVTLNPNHCIRTDEKQRTNIPFVYAAGDVTEKYSQQVISAVHEGAIAAESVNYDLYTPEQKE